MNMASRRVALSALAVTAWCAVSACSCLVPSQRPWLSLEILGIWESREHPVFVIRLTPQGTSGGLRVNQFSLWDALSGVALATASGDKAQVVGEGRWEYQVPRPGQDLVSVPSDGLVVEVPLPPGQKLVVESGLDGSIGSPEDGAELTYTTAVTLPGPEPEEAAEVAFVAVEEVPGVLSRLPLRGSGRCRYSRVR